MSSLSSPQLVPHVLGAAVLSMTLWGLAGCAGPQAYVPFQQPSTLSVEARWEAMLSLAKTEQWTIIESDVGTAQMVAYRYYDMPGIRDRIKVALLSDRTVVETGSEIEEEKGRWTSSSDRCAKYDFVREKVVVARIEHAAADPLAPPADGRAPELLLPASRSVRVCGSGIR